MTANGMKGSHLVSARIPTRRARAKDLLSRKYVVTRTNRVHIMTPPDDEWLLMWYSFIPGQTLCGLSMEPQGYTGESLVKNQFIDDLHGLPTFNRLKPCKRCAKKIMEIEEKADPEIWLDFPTLKELMQD